MASKDDIGLVFALHLCFVSALFELFVTNKISRRRCDTVNHGYWCNTALTHFWGPYTPFYSVRSKITRHERSCKPTFVQVLSRHGARGPTASQAKKIQSTLKKIQSSNTTYSQETVFIQDYVFDLVPDQLTDFGEQEMVNSGKTFYSRYAKLAKHQEIFVRSSGQERVVVSARKFAQGYCKLAHKSPSCTRDKSSPLPILAIPEDDGFNNTLSHGLCQAFEEGEHADLDKVAAANFTAVFAPPITARLNSQLVGADLTNDDTVNIMSLCAFGSVSNPDAFPLSPFCSLFTVREWKSYNYLQSLTKFYNIGPGNPLGATQGVGWVNELIARMTNTPVVDHTSTNTTLDASPETFPLDLKLYADFSHDNDMVGIMSALGLFADMKMMSTVEQNDDAEFLASELVPFASRIYVEKLRCKGESEEQVRVVVNNRVMPMVNCGSDSGGRCTLSRFIAGLSFARNGGLWDQC